MSERWSTSSGFFYECDIARTAGFGRYRTLSGKPIPRAWSVIRSSTEVDLSSIEGTLADLETEITDAQECSNRSHRGRDLR